MKVSARVLSVILTICLLAGLLPAEALAERADSDSIEPLPQIEDMAFDEPEEGQPDDEPEEAVAELYAEVASGTCGDNLTWVLDDEGTLTISGTGEMGNDPSWGGMKNSIKTVIVEAGVTSIGDHAFSWCTGLTSVTIPESVTSVGDYAFDGCSELASVMIPESVTSIGNWVFLDCSGLNCIAVSSGNLNYASEEGVLFDKQKSILISYPKGKSSSSYVIPDSVTSIGEGAFSDCSRLTNVTIPEGVTSIGDYAFSYCNGLTSVTIPEGVTSIGWCAFADCSGLTSVTIPEGVTSIGFYAFSRCSGLTSVTIPGDVASIGYYAFDGCTGLTSAGPIGGGYDYQFGWETAIPDYAFAGCSGLTSVTIPESMTSIGSNTFSGCTGLVSAGPIGGDYDYQFGWKTAIPDLAFSGCSGLTNVIIPERVTSIGNYAFSGCSELTSVTIPEGMTSIGAHAFSWCSGLTSVTIPESVTFIGYDAFEGCVGLPSVKIPEDVPSIGWWAFSGCPGLTSVVIPEGVTSIGNYVFDGCTGLISVTIPEGVTSIGQGAFSGCSGLTSVTIPDSATSIESWAFSGCSGLTSVAIPEGVTSIGNYVFSGCTGLTSVTIPESVTSIGKRAFSWCAGLTNVTIPESVTSIGDSAFYGCSELTSVIIPESVTSIEDFAFEDCNPDLCIYCYPGSYAESYAIENNINYALLSKVDDEVLTWLTFNAPSGVVAGTEFLIRTGFSAQKPASTLQIDLPQGVALSTIWLDGTELASGSYTLTNGSLTVSLVELPDKPAHTLYLYCVATDAGSYSVSGMLTLLDGEKHFLGTAVIQAEQARLNVPEKVGYTTGIIATGKANPGCGVTLFVDGANAGQTTANDAGSWQITFDLGAGVESGSSHTVYAEIQLANGQTVETAKAAVVHQACAVNPVKVTMYNTGDHGAQETVFDFTKPEEANLIRYYRIWPSRYPSFTFKAEFSGDPATLSGVSILTTDSAGNETRIPAVYDPASRSWVGTRDYTSFQDAPVWVRVVYDAEEISSNKLSAVPIMDPSGYVYEAVPSNRLAGVKATVFSEQDGNTLWNANAFDQVNPQITGADGSYYWDVPAGNWKVTFSKEGYTDTETGWLTVPPPQVDINVPMISNAAPEVKYAAVYEDYAELTFSQYMNIDSVKSAITLNGKAATVEALDAEDNADKTAQYATRFKAVTTGLSGQVTLTVSTASNYAGTVMRGTYAQTFSVETRPTEIDAPETVSMEMSAEQSIRAALVPGVSGRTLAIENLTPAIISIGGTSAATGSDGGAEISVKALLPGIGILRITEPVSGLETTVSVQVKADAAPEISIDASIDGSFLKYQIANAPEKLDAKLIIASYSNQRMEKVIIEEALSGALELKDPLAGSYVLFLAESDTMKPLCPNVTVSAGTGSGA